MKIKKIILNAMLLGSMYTSSWAMEGEPSTAPATTTQEQLQELSQLFGCNVDDKDNLITMINTPNKQEIIFGFRENNKQVRTLIYLFQKHFSGQKLGASFMPLLRQLSSINVTDSVAFVCALLIQAGFAEMVLIITRKG